MSLLKPGTSDYITHTIISSCFTKPTKKPTIPILSHSHAKPSEKPRRAKQQRLLSEAKRRVGRLAALAVGADGTARALHEEDRGC